MGKSRRVLLDECVASKRTASFLNAALPMVMQAAPVFTLLTVYMDKTGERDKVWVPAAAQDGFDLVVSADQGRKKVGDKLPEICLQYGLRHVLVSPRLHHSGLEAIAFAVAEKWLAIEHACEIKDCIRFSLQLKQIDSREEVGDHRVALVKKPPRR